MDTQEASLYHVYLITILVVVGLGLYFMISAMRLRYRFRRAYDARLEQEINKLESEKERIARDLHDDVGPVLTAIRMNLDSLVITTPSQEESLQKSIACLATLTRKIRNVSTDLMPTVLKEKGLAIAIEQYIDNLAAFNSLHITFYYDDLPALPPQKSLHIFRIVQEIIHNTFKHAAATRLEINISHEENQLILTSIDDGRGFTYEPSILFKTGYGLSNINSRIQSVKGNITIDTSPSKGTRYYMELPIS